jgi:hypothetical protein
MQPQEDLFGPVPSVSAAATLERPEATRASHGVLIALALGGAQCVAMGATYALFALRVGYIFSVANIAMGHVMGRTIRGRIGARNASLAPVMAAAFTYAAGAMLFLPAVAAGLADWGQGASLQQENLQWVRGHESRATVIDGALPLLYLLLITLKAPLLAAGAGHPVPLLFIGLGIAAAVRASVR